MREFFTALGKIVLKVFEAIAKFQRWLLEEICPKIPGWNLLLALCRKLLAPVTKLGAWLQRKFPRLRNWEWLLEIDGLRARHPVMLMVMLTLVFTRGIGKTQHGHIATDALVYPLLGGLSYLNPYLGLVAAVVFGASDLVQKVFANDMYGTASTGDYLGAMLGYTIAYTSVAAMGLAPGMLSRVFSLAVRKILQAVFSGGARAAADGADAFQPDDAMRAVPRDAWQQAIDSGHPVDAQWQRFLDTRGFHEPGAATLARIGVPAQGLQTYIERNGAPPGGWGEFCTATGTPLEPWMQVPGAGPPGGAAQWLAANGLPPGPPVPSAADWLAQAAGATNAVADDAAAAAARARARHSQEAFEIRRQMDIAREEAMRRNQALIDSMPTSFGRMPGSFMPQVAGGPPDVAFVFPELIASLLGAAVGGWVVVDFVAPVTEWPAFYLRPNPDVSCYASEVKVLDGLATDAAFGTGGFGPATSILVPPTGPGGPGGPGLQPGIDPDALKEVIATRDYHQNNANRLRQDLATATDPRVREELTRRLEATEANVASANDEIHRATTGEFQRTRTAWDDRQDKIQAEQSRQMAADLKASADARAAAAKKAAADAHRPEWEAEQARLQKEADRMAAQTGLGFVLTRAFTGSVKEVVETGTAAVKWTGTKLGEGYEFGKKVVRDPVGYTKAALNATWQTAKDGANYVGETVNEAWRDIKQGRTWEILKGTAAGSALTVGKVVGTTGQVIYQTVTDPKKMLEVAKDALGANDFEKSWDPNLSLTDRLKHVGIGVTKLYGTLATAGQVGTFVKQGLNTLGKSQLVGKVKTGLKGALGLGDDIARAPKPKVFPPRPAKFVPGIDTQISLSPGTNIKPALKGMTDPGMKHLQVIADKHGARIAVRPSNPYSAKLIENGALPKPAWQKMKTINDLDTHLGAGVDSRGKVGLFKPKLPDEKLYDPKTFAKIKDRYDSRMKEWKSYAPDFKQMELEGKIKIREGAIHAPDGTPYAGDYDIFQVTGANGEKLPDAVRDRIIKELQQPPFRAQHGAHLDWATTSAKEAGMKVNIASGHAATVPAKIENGIVIKDAHPGEPLITAIGGETERAGAAGGRFVASHYNIPTPAPGGAL